MRALRRSPLWAVVSAALLIVVRSAQAACCPGDINGDHVVTVDEILTVVNAALDGCAAFPVPCQGGGLLSTGQTQCDQGAGTLGACPGSPAGQDAAVGAGAALSYKDNGDGTITDNVTGLMWEKLSQDGSIHDVNSTYAWSDAFDVKIAELNTADFAGHDDWRLPNRRELESLVDADRSAPAVNPVFNAGCTPGCTMTTCSCTQVDLPYWSSTTYHDRPTFAWAVDHNVGIVNAFEKNGVVVVKDHVRAVRGGL